MLDYSFRYFSSIFWRVFWCDRHTFMTTQWIFLSFFTTLQINHSLIFHTFVSQQSSLRHSGENIQSAYVINIPLAVNYLIQTDLGIKHNYVASLSNLPESVLWEPGCLCQIKIELKASFCKNVDMLVTNCDEGELRPCFSSVSTANILIQTTCSPDFNMQTSSYSDLLNCFSHSMSFSLSNLWKERSFTEPHAVTPTNTYRRAAAVCGRHLFLLSGLFDLWS